MVWWSIIWFGKVEKLLKYLVSGNEVECSTFMSKLFVAIRVSMGRFESGLCPTQNRLAHIERKVEWPAADRRQSQVKSDQSSVDSDRVSRSRSVFQPLDLSQIFTGSLSDLLIFLRICVTTMGSKQKPPSVIGIGSTDFQVDLNDLDRWVGFRFLVDGPMWQYQSIVKIEMIRGDLTVSLSLFLLILFFLFVSSWF